MIHEGVEEVPRLKVVTVKLDSKLNDMLEEMVEKTKLRKSDILRMAIAYYYKNGNWRNLA